ncbi:MAG: hypothetical protein NWE98_00795 [Candidatus Bathyarchaeota archaeon]|nr:hypothetical protein [Candidatus Bathyarchaeota archaeon]
MSRTSLHPKPIAAFIIILLTSTIAFPVISSSLVAAQEDGYYHKSFAWDYNGNHWTWNLSIPTALYDAYKSVPVYTRTREGPAGYGFLTTTQDYYLKLLAQKLNETTTSQHYGSFDQVSFVLAFVQSLPYTSDSVTTGHDEYPRFPIETLVDGGGDCEDTSILFATLTLIMGYGTVYINPPDHYAVGILGNNLSGTYWTYSNKTYYYCETTGDGFKIGQLPEEFQGQKAYIYPIDQSTQYIPLIEVVPTPEPTPTEIPITTSPEATFNPDLTPTATPPIDQPDNVRPQQISFNLISEQPLLFALIVLAIGFSIGLAMWSAKRPKASLPPPPKTETGQPAIPDPQPNQLAEEIKFCIYCGSSNKSVAVYCERCGKQIG